MDSNLSDATAGAFATPAFVHVAISDLRVNERAVTLRGRGGELCPQSVWISGTSLKPGLQQSSMRISSSFPFATTDNVRIYTTPIGSNAISGTG